jgi:hypothetical protein
MQKKMADGQMESPDFQLLKKYMSTHNMLFSEEV